MSLRAATRDRSITSYATTFDPEGRFELLLEPHISTSLDLSGSCGGTRIRVSTQPKIVAGVNDWSYDFETARIEGMVDPAKLSMGAGLLYESARDTVSITTDIVPNAEGRFGPSTVPAGPGILRLPGGIGIEPGPAWSELDLEPGELRRLDLP